MTPIVAAMFLGIFALAQEAPRSPARPAHPDVVFADVSGRRLALDLYLPVNASTPPLIVWVHGGAWTTGTKANIPSTAVAACLQAGFAVASVDFRQSTEARFPAQAHDIKAAIRFLRAKARTYGYGTAKIAILGNSSGGHLAALVGVTNRHDELEGKAGAFLDQSSDVHAIVSYFGASNLQTILAQSTPFGLNVRQPALERLLGSTPDRAPELAKLASPVTHIDSTDPPLFLLHGDQDPQMPINQAHELDGAYQKHGLDVSFRVVHGAGHGGDLFFSPDNLRPVLEFLKRTVSN